MNKRPISISIIAWYMIVSCAISLVTTLVSYNNSQVQEIMARSPVPVSVQMAIGVGVAAINLICGVFMLKGANWSRLTFVTISVISFAYSFYASPIKLILIPALLILALIIFFLFRPEANAFFTGRSSATPPPLP